VLTGCGLSLLEVSVLHEVPDVSTRGRCVQIAAGLAAVGAIVMVAVVALV
jgi:hypothetical protein